LAKLEVQIKSLGSLYSGKWKVETVM